MRFINCKARQLYEKIQRRAVIVEDAYVVPEGMECFDTLDQDLYYGSHSYGFLLCAIQKLEQYEESGLSFEEAAIQVVSDFVLVADKIFMTKEALAKVKEFLSKGVLEELTAKEREEEKNDLADMQAAQKEKEEQDAFPSSAYW